MNNRLIELMQRAFNEVWATSQERKGNLRTAALKLGISRVARAKTARGVFP